MSFGEGCGLRENFTVPDTKVNFHAWKNMEVMSFSSVLRGELMCGAGKRGGRRGERKIKSQKERERGKERELLGGHLQVLFILWW